MYCSYSFLRDACCQTCAQASAPDDDVRSVFESTTTLAPGNWSSSLVALISGGDSLVARAELEYASGPTFDALFLENASFANDMHLTASLPSQSVAGYIALAQSSFMTVVHFLDAVSPSWSGYLIEAAFGSSE
eukprot:7077487-Prymnesium_polylepis.1